MNKRYVQYGDKASVHRGVSVESKALRNMLRADKDRSECNPYSYLAGLVDGEDKTMAKLKPFVELARTAAATYAPELLPRIDEILHGLQR